MAEKKKQPERGVGSNQHADKPPRVVSDDELARRRDAAGRASEAVQDLAGLSEDLSSQLDSYIQNQSRPIPDRYSSFVHHPVNPYLNESTGDTTSERETQEWVSMYSPVLADGAPRRWNPTGRISVGYVGTTPLGEPEFLVSVADVTPPADLLSFYGVEENAALNYAESDRVLVDGTGNYEDANSADPPPDIPVIAFAFLPEPTKERIKDIVHYHIQFGKVWEATYDEHADVWRVLVKYGHAFKEETWPKHDPQDTETDDFDGGDASQSLRFT